MPEDTENPAMTYEAAGKNESMTEWRRVSIIVPVYNRERLIVRCLDSIACQDWPDMEIIVVDNASSDGSIDAAMAWAREHRRPGMDVKVLSETKRGACAARNSGFARSTGEFIVFFDSDDAMRPDLVRRAMDAFEERGNADIVCWPCRIHDLDGSSRVPPFQPRRPIEGHLIHTLLRPQGYMARRDVFSRAGVWDENLPSWNDWELGVRIILIEPKIGWVDGVLADIYSQKESITGEDFSSKAGVWEKSLDAAKRDIADSSADERTKRRMLGIVSYREAILAAHYAREGRRELAAALQKRALADVAAGEGAGTGFLRRMALRLAYGYTRRGGRGIWRLLRHVM